MASLTIKNVPDRVIKRLKAYAKQHRRSLNYEVLACLRAATQPTPIDSNELLTHIASVRCKPTGFRLTDRALNQLKSSRKP